MDLEANKPSTLVKQHKSEDNSAPFSIVGALLAIGLGVWAYALLGKHAAATDSETCTGAQIITLLHVLFFIEIVQASVLTANVVNALSGRSMQMLNAFSGILSLVSKATGISTWLVSTMICWQLWSNGCKTAAPIMFHDVSVLMFSFWGAIILTLCCCCAVMSFALCVGARITVVDGLENMPEQKHH
jgi:hypothetical protein